ncbi:MAG TPA: ABC transporter permease [Pyrinomonadaceae bacterium]|jgi:putative ABC transport system permease protein
MNTLWHDLRYGLRMLAKSPGFTAVAVVALALGIGANTAIFSIVNAMLLRALPYGDPDRLVVVWETNPNLSSPYLRTHNEASPANFLDWRAQQTVFEDIAAYRFNDYNLTAGDTPEQLAGNPVTANMFDVLKVKPLLGRTFRAEDGDPKSDRVAVLSYGLWQRRFGGDAGIVGRTINLNGNPTTIVGVMPADFEFPAPFSQLWTALRFATDTPPSRQAHFLYTRARLKPGVTIAQAEGELRTIAARLRQQYPDTNADRDVRLVPLHAQTVEQARAGLLVLLGAVAFVLLIACANVANLMLARATARHREIAIRTALGAGRWRIIRQLLTESVLLSTLGGALGVLLALWGLDLLTAAVPREFTLYIHGWNQIRLDRWVLAFTFGVSVLTGVLFGLVPALQASKTDLNEALKEGGRGGATHARKRFRGALVVAEVALALVLLVGAGLLLKSFLRLIEVQPGFDPHNIVTAQLALPPARYKENAQVVQFFEQLTARVAAQPGVEAVGTIDMLPMAGSGGTTTFIVDGRPLARAGVYPEANARTVDPGYFNALRIPVLRGRNFTAQDRAGAAGVCVVNETFARLFFPGEDAVGKTLRNPDGTNPFQIVGVVGDIKHFGLDDEAEAYIYAPQLQLPSNGVALVVRSRADTAALTAMIRREVRALDPDQPVFDVKTMETRIAETTTPARLGSFLLTLFALVALTLAAVGIYGVMAYSVTQRTHELGVRMALGAQPRDVLRLVVGQAMLLVVGGLALGLVASFALMRWLASRLFQVSPADPTTFAAVTLLLAAVGLLACLVPARRATKVDPMIALRYE